jgi:pantetheine-phosphate adenylyltransferase
METAPFLNMANRTLFTGTFDPPSLGHLDLIERASNLSAHLTVGVAEISHKTGALLSLNQRVAFLKEITNHLENVEVVPFKGLAVDLAKEMQADCLIRGLRSSADLTYEREMAAANLALSGIETLFLLGSEKTGHISSTIIREVGACNHDLFLFVPSVLEARIRSVLSK